MGREAVPRHAVVLGGHRARRAEPVRHPVPDPVGGQREGRPQHRPDGVLAHQHGGLRDGARVRDLPRRAGADHRPDPGHRRLSAQHGPAAARAADAEGARLKLLGIASLLAIATLLALWPRADASEWRGTEARRVQIALEMAESGDLMVPTLGREQTLAKPPLFYWALVGLFDR